MPTAQTGQDRILYYVHDPMCSWCWAFRPVWSALTRDLPAGIRPQRLLGGLAPDTREPMPQQMRDEISAIWQQIQQRLPATEFNYDFWQRCTPRRSTYPACRAVISARNQGAGFEEPMILAIQRAYYLEARNPSEEETLAELAEAIGLDGDEFVRDLNAAATQAALEREMLLGRRMGARGFPSLILEASGARRLLEYDYQQVSTVLSQLSP